MSRRKCEEAILSERILVNGRTAVLGERVDTENDRVSLDGETVTYAGESRRTYIMLNKPMGYVTTLSDEKDRHTVAELTKDCNTRVYPVGRLDMYSDGLLIMTDDGELANRLMRPSSKKKKIYRLCVKGEFGPELCDMLSTPMELDGRPLMKVECKLIGSGEQTKDRKPTTVVEIGLCEGRNRQIRRMCEKIGVKVVRLTRISEAGINLDTLPVGKWRYLTENEISILKEGQ